MDYGRRSHIGLTNDEIADLGRKALDTTDPEGASKARDTLVQRFLGLALSIANERADVSGASEEERKDLIQDGMLGLVRAAHGYDPDRGPFAPYAQQWIRHFILRGPATRTGIIRLPKQARARLRLVLETRESLIASGLERPTTAQVAQRAGMDEKKVIEVLNSASPGGWAEFSPANEGDTTESGGMEEAVARMEIEDMIGGTPLEAEYQEWMETDGTERGLKRLASKIKKHLAATGER